MKIAVIGAGSWGTALSQLLARNGHDVKLWSRRESVSQAINQTRHNPDYLNGFELSERITASSDLREVISDAFAIVVVTPSKAMRQTACALKEAGYGLADGEEAPPSKDIDPPLLLCTKGIDLETGKGSVQVFAEVLGSQARLACLSGPNHAEEVICDTPAATVVASGDEGVAGIFQDLLGSNTFRVYTSRDTVGVEFCGAAKNVIAIAVGVAYGLGYGDNTAAMIMTRGQAEISRLVEAAGGNPLTCMGLAGTGDLIATCMSHHSRNRMFGEALALGETLEDYEERRHMVVEGAQACRSLSEVSKWHDVELPLIEAVDAVIWDHVDVSSIADTLLARSFKPEFY